MRGSPGQESVDIHGGRVTSVSFLTMASSASCASAVMLVGDQGLGIEFSAKPGRGAPDAAVFVDNMKVPRRGGY